MTGCPGKVDSLALHRTSRWKANGRTHEISVWDVSDKGSMGREARMLPGHEKQVSAHAWRPDGTGVVATTVDGTVAAVAA